MVERRASGVVLPVATPGMATSNVLQRRVPRLQEQKKNMKQQNKQLNFETSNFSN